MENQNKKIVIISTIAVILVLLTAGVFLYSKGYLDKYLGYLIGQKLTSQNNEEEPKPVFKLLGKILSVSDEFITIEAYQTYKEIILPDGRKAFSSQKVKVNINNNTQFFKTQSGAQNLPDSQKIPTTLSDLKVGETIEATSNEDIKEKDEVLAKTITLLIQ